MSHRPQAAALSSSSDSCRKDIRHAVGALVVEHESLLALAGLADAGIALGVVGPRLGPGDPAALDPRDRAVDVEHLEQELEARAPEVDDRLERRRGQGPGDWASAASTASACSWRGIDADAK